jgi:hypothetical protein
MNWPPRYLDLTLLDFCLQGWMKSKVYRRKMDTRDQLLNLIRDAITHIRECQDTLRRAPCHVPTQCAKCIDFDGGIF